MITVTRWRHPSTIAALILPGTPEETREEALQYFADQPDQPDRLTGSQEQMSQLDFDSLPEFEA